MNNEQQAFASGFDEGWSKAQDVIAELDRLRANDQFLIRSLYKKIAKLEAVIEMAEDTGDLERRVAILEQRIASATEDDDERDCRAGS